MQNNVISLAERRKGAQAPAPRVGRPPRPAFTPRLAEYRRAAGLTQEQVGEFVGVAAEMVRRHERGINMPIAMYRERYSELFGATQQELGWPVGALPVAVPALAIAGGAR